MNVDSGGRNVFMPTNPIGRSCLLVVKSACARGDAGPVPDHVRKR